MVFEVFFSLLAYLIGSLPFSDLIAKARGINLKRVGSGNVGATNVARSVGLPYGLLALLLDGAKGALTVQLALLWSLPIWLAGFAVVGHNWSLFLNFKSGKGVATSLGILLLLSWPIFLLTIALWLLTAWLTRYVSIASVGALLASPLGLILWGASLEAIVLMAVLGVLSVFQHRENFQRLIRGQEHKLG